jgi:molybdate transport system substrate-binding protein
MFRSLTAKGWGRTLLLLSLALLSAPIALTQHATPKELHVAAASDLESVLPALAAAYERQAGVHLVISYGSSANLTQQIENGAPQDLFLSADYSFPEQLVASNLTDERDPVAYAHGVLVLWARNDFLKANRLGALSLDTLTNAPHDARIQKVALANPDHAPYGRAAEAALNNLGLKPALVPKLVIAQNIAQAAQFVESGNAQLGLISLTTASTQHFREIGSYVRIPASQYPELRQCAVVINRSPNRTAAHAFLQWLTSEAVQSKLPQFGLEPVQ